jgi:hypothetical protein
VNAYDRAELLYLLWAIPVLAVALVASLSLLAF